MIQWYDFELKDGSTVCTQAKNRRTAIANLINHLRWYGDLDSQGSVRAIRVKPAHRKVGIGGKNYYRVFS